MQVNEASSLIDNTKVWVAKGDLPDLEGRLKVYKGLADFECWNLMFQFLDLAIQSPKVHFDDFQVRAEIEYKDFGDLDLFTKTCVQAIQRLRLDFVEIHTHLVARILGQANWREEAKVLELIWTHFTTKKSQSLCLERLCLLYEKKIFQEERLGKTYHALLDLQPDNLKALRYFKMVAIQEHNWEKVEHILGQIIHTSARHEDKFRSGLELAAVQLYQLDKPREAITTIETHCGGAYLDSSTIHLEAYQRLGDGAGCLRFSQLFAKRMSRRV